MQIDGNSIFIDVTFFGYPNWRVILNSDKPIIKHDLDKHKIQQIIFIQDFEDLDNRKKYIGFIYEGEDKSVYYDVNF